MNQSKYAILLITFLIVFFNIDEVCAQKSITKRDIAVVTQLTLLKVDSTDVAALKKSMEAISILSKQIELEETYEWLLYSAGYNQFLIINFSEGTEDILTVTSYTNRFKNTKAYQAFLNEIAILKSLKIKIVFNLLKEMILPWSTIEEISVNEFPLATMEVYEYATSSAESLDIKLRNRAKELKNNNFTYPLEVSRGSVGAYGRLFLVWFYDNQNKYKSEKNILSEYQDIQEEINTIATPKKVYNLIYKPKLSY